MTHQGVKSAFLKCAGNNQRTQIIMLPCIAAVAIATYVGKKTFESHANETSSLLMQNVEALSGEVDNNVENNGCKTNSVFILRKNKCIHGNPIGFLGTKYSCAKGNDSICTDGYEGTDVSCQGDGHLPTQASPSVRDCK